MRIPAPSSDLPLARRVPEIRHDRSLRSSNRRSRDRRNHGAPETQPLKNQQLCFELNEAFLIKRNFLHAFVVLWFGPSSVPTSPRNLKFGIVLRSSNCRSRDRRNHVVPESKPNPVSPQLYFENDAFFSISYQNVFFSTLSWFRGFRGFVVWSVQVSKSDRPRIDRTLSVRRIFFWI